MYSPTCDAPHPGLLQRSQLALQFRDATSQDPDEPETTVNQNAQNNHHDIGAGSPPGASGNVYLPVIVFRFTDFIQLK